MRYTGLQSFIFLCRSCGKLRITFLFILTAGFFYQQSSAQLVSDKQTYTSVNLIPESARILSEYLKIESVTGNEGNAGRFLLDQCIRNGLNITLFSDKDNQFNFAASVFPLKLGLPNIIFLNHIDVVPPGNADSWIFDPFSGMIKDGMIHGRGALDMKGMAIMQLEAISAFATKHREDLLQFNVTILCVSGEEDFGTFGTDWVVDQFLDQLNPIVVYSEGGAGVRGVLSSNPETPVMCISIADKKALWLELKVEEPSSGHGSVPPLDYSNKTAMLELNRILNKKPRIFLDDYNKMTIRKLGELETGIRGFVLRNISLFKPFIAGKLRKDPLVLATLTNTVTLTNIYNPLGSKNQIAQETTAALDCRLLPGYSAQRFLMDIRKKIKNDNTTVSIINQSNDAEASQLNDHYYRLASSLKKIYPDCEVLPVLFPAVTDNNHFREHKVPTFGINPICLDKDMLMTIHNNNERLSIENLEKGIMVYFEILESVLEDQTNLLSRKQEPLSRSLK